MFALFLSLIVVGAVLTVLLWGGTYFFQGYIYTEPSPGVFWQAPATAVLLTVGYLIWCITIATTAGATPQNLPIDTLIRFSAIEDMLDRPAPRVWAVTQSQRKGATQKDGKKILYVSKRLGPNQYQYKHKGTSAPWQGQDVVAIEIEKDDGTTMRFDFKETDEGGTHHYVSPDGWEMVSRPQDGPTGLPTRFRSSRLYWNLFFNFGHLIVWFLGLWLVLRFQWGHALGFAVVAWLVMTLTILPMLLSYAGAAASGNQEIKTITMLIQPLAA